AVPGNLRTIQIKVDEVTSRNALAVNATSSRYLLNDSFELLADRLDLIEIRTKDLDSHRRADSGGQHVDAVADRHRPRVRLSWNLYPLVHLIDQFFPRHRVRPERTEEALQESRHPSRVPALSRSPL